VVLGHREGGVAFAVELDRLDELLQGGVEVPALQRGLVGVEVGLSPGLGVVHHRGHSLEVPLRRLKVTGHDFQLAEGVEQRRDVGSGIATTCRGRVVG
jgi:hypothetical protein